MTLPIPLRPTLPGLPLMARRSLVPDATSDAELRRMIRSGALLRVHTGMYLPAGAQMLPSEQYRLRCLAVAARNPRCALSHVSAAAVHRLPLITTPTQVHLTRLGACGAEIRGRVRVHAGPLTDQLLAQVDGLPLTSIDRTLRDIACSGDDRTTVVLVDAALQRGLTTTDRLRGSIALMRGRRGAPGARRAFFRADGRSESAGESLARFILATPGSPVLDCQIEIHDDKGRLVGRADLGNKAAGVLLEFDGRVKYGRLNPWGVTGEEVLAQEKDREDALRRLNYFVERVTWDQFRRPEELRARIAKVIIAGLHERQVRPLLGTYQPQQPITLAV